MKYVSRAHTVNGNQDHFVFHKASPSLFFQRLPQIFFGYHYTVITVKIQCEA